MSAIDPVTLAVLKGRLEQVAVAVPLPAAIADGTTGITEDIVRRPFETAHQTSFKPVSCVATIADDLCEVQGDRVFKMRGQG